MDQFFSKMDKYHILKIRYLYCIIYNSCSFVSIMIFWKLLTVTGLGNFLERRFHHFGSFHLFWRRRVRYSVVDHVELSLVHETADIIQ